MGQFPGLCVSVCGVTGLTSVRRRAHHLTRPCGQTSFSLSGFRSILGAGPVTPESVSAVLTLADEAMSAWSR